jgi:hypothetical protein
VNDAPQTHEWRTIQFLQMDDAPKQRHRIFQTEEAAQRKLQSVRADPRTLSVWLQQRTVGPWRLAAPVPRP